MSIDINTAHALKLESRVHPGHVIVRDIGNTRITVVYALPPRVHFEELVAPTFAWYWTAQEFVHPEDGESYLSDATSLSEEEAEMLCSGKSLDQVMQRRDGIATELWARIGRSRS